MLGIIVDWQDERGFGFIEMDSGERVFFHITDFVPDGDRRPELGETVSFVLTPSRTGTQAKNVTPVGRKWASAVVRGLSDIALLLVVITICSGLWWLTANRKLPFWFLYYLAGINFFTFILYGFDKFAAKRDMRRIPEIWLHFCEFFGAWPAALLAQRLFHHKTKKTSFLKTFWCMAVLNVALVAVVAALALAGNTLLDGLKTPTSKATIALHEILARLPGIGKILSSGSSPPPKTAPKTARSEPARLEISKPEPTRSESAQPESTRSKPAQSKPAQSEPAQPESAEPDTSKFFSYRVSLKSGKEIAARQAKRDGQWVKIVTSSGLYMEIPSDDVDYILKINTP